ncbi:MAG: hypothetical protein JWN24_408 [Phycisphaerales bacterium]|nr:hypothetical protein [Phycisphaerales bacterium]
MQAESLHHKLSDPKTPAPSRPVSQGAGVFVFVILGRFRLSGLERGLVGGKLT